MSMTMEEFDRLTRYLISNGDVPAVKSQGIYEYAWDQGIRPVREEELKPDVMVRRRKRDPAGRRPGRGVRRTLPKDLEGIRRMERDACRALDVGQVYEQLERWKEERSDCGGWWE